MSALPSSERLKAAYIGKTLHDIPLPSAVLDHSKIKHNCALMLDAVTELQVGFRAHVKTHKTAELTRLQVGENSQDVRLVVSTVTEAEFLLPLMQDYQNRGARVNVLYGVPLSQSHVPRLAALGQKLGAGAIAAMIDNPSQIVSAQQFKIQAGFPLLVFIKTDSGYHRAGLTPESVKMTELVKQISEAEVRGDLELHGFYSHNSLSYGGNSPADAMDMLKLEIDVCHQASQHLKNVSTRARPLVISVGASPTALAIQNIQSSSPSATSTMPSASALRSSLDLARSSRFELEIHAGVYPVFDLQQVAASSRTFASSTLAHDTIALTVLTEVISTYPDRTSAPEALVNAGCLALAREPCKSYPGWGIVSSWNMNADIYSDDLAANSEARIMVSRISQEHGILGWQQQERTDELPLVYGQRLRIWPNHACITGAGFEYYLIVDSTGSAQDEIVDVWVRCRGW